MQLRCRCTAAAVCCSAVLGMLLTSRPVLVISSQVFGLFIFYLLVQPALVFSCGQLDAGWLTLFGALVCWRTSGRRILVYNTPLLSKSFVRKT